MKEKGNRIKGMDGLRGIAIIGITLFHMFPNVFKGGYLGVVLFFVLTGFLMVITNKKKLLFCKWVVSDKLLQAVL